MAATLAGPVPGRPLLGRCAETDRVLGAAAAGPTDPDLVVELALARADNQFHWLDRPADGRATQAAAAGLCGATTSAGGVDLAPKLAAEIGIALHSRVRPPT